MKNDMKKRILSAQLALILLLMLWCGTYFETKEMFIFLKYFFYYSNHIIKPMHHSDRILLRQVQIHLLRHLLS